MPKVRFYRRGSRGEGSGPSFVGGSTHPHAALLNDKAANASMQRNCHLEYFAETSCLAGQESPWTTTSASRSRQRPGEKTDAQVWTNVEWLKSRMGEVLKRMPGGACFYALCTTLGRPVCLSKPPWGLPVPGGRAKLTLEGRLGLPAADQDCQESSGETIDGYLDRESCDAQGVSAPAAAYDVDVFSLLHRPYQCQFRGADDEQGHWAERGRLRFQLNCLLCRLRPVRGSQQTWSWTRLAPGCGWPGSW